jgi:putative Mn2+ efflux pump MntP
VVWIQGIDPWVAFVLLAYVGGQMIRSGFSHEQKNLQVDPSKGWSLVILSVATSLDALAVGMSFAMLGQEILFPSLLIGIVAFGLSGIGLFAGRKLGEMIGKRMEVIGGLVLIGIGMRILITHIYV